MTTISSPRSRYAFRACHSKSSAPRAHHRTGALCGADGQQQPHDGAKIVRERQRRRRPEEGERAQRGAHDVDQAEALPCFQQPAQTGRAGDERDRKTEYAQRLERLGLERGWDLQAAGHQPRRRRGQDRRHDDAHHTHDGKPGPGEYWNFPVPPGTEPFRDLLGEDAPQPEIEQTRISVQHAGQCQHAKNGRARGR